MRRRVVGLLRRINCNRLPQIPAQGLQCHARQLTVIGVSEAWGRRNVSEERAAGLVDKRLGERVRRRRLEIGMSQEKLADLLGVTFQQVQKYEKGVNRIAASRLLSIAQALEVPVASLFENLLDAAVGDAINRGIDKALTNPDVIDLVMVYDRIENVKIRRRVLELVREMADAEN